MNIKWLIPLYIGITAATSYSANADEVAITTPRISEIALAADFNRDGKIEFVQQTTQNGARTDLNTEDQPYVFWINDDDDFPSLETRGHDIKAESGFFSSRFPDYGNHHIDGSRDFIDFFAVGLDLNKELVTSQESDNKTYWLQHDDEAVNIVYTTMSRGTTNGAGLSSDYLKKIDMSDVKNIFGEWQSQGDLSEVPVYTVTAAGIEIPEEFIEQIKEDENKGVILVEGTKTSQLPLKLLVKDENNNLLIDVELPLHIYPVTQLYRQTSLRGDERDEQSKIWGVSPTTVDPVVTGLITSLNEQSAAIALRTPEVNTAKHVIYLHGFNNDEDAASAFQNETFKRLYHSGSNALFTGVHWQGNEGTPAAFNYWDNVENAFYVADDFAELVKGILGTKIIIAHSLGNMVVGNAIQEFSMSFNKYFMLDPAVALEAYDEAEEHPEEMRHPDWNEYYFGSDYNPSADTENYNDQLGRRLWAVEWYQLFPDTDDHRSKLTWRDRFSTVGASANVVQYYSSGEEVLKAAEPGPPNPYDSGVGYLPFNDSPIGLNAWNIQEKSKGTSNLAAISAGNSSAGWGFNEPCVIAGLNIFCRRNSEMNHTEAQVLFDAPEGLIQAPFFDPFINTELHELNRNNVAAATSYPHNLAAEMPALSLAAGGTRSTAFPSNNVIDMNNEMADGWPAGRGGETEREWFHSDFKDISYRYTYKLFDHIVLEGVLR
jgi:hypothetical protein